MVETLDVAARPFGALEAGFARPHGEGDRTLAWFRARIGGHYAAQFADRGLPFGDDSLLVTERFRVLYRLPDPD